jgi:hypothetical protein
MDVEEKQQESHFWSSQPNDGRFTDSQRGELSPMRERNAHEREALLVD